MKCEIDLSEDYENSGVSAVLNQLNEELIGLNPVKKRIKEISALLLVDKARQSLNLENIKPSLHMSFTGNPGTGKTTVANRISEILFRLKYLRKGHLVTVTRDDLVGQYVGHTAPKTKEIIKRARGGVLFIDEAYFLHKKSNDRDYGSEAIEILLQSMENERDDLVVIFAGYKELMNDFYKANQGLYSRIAHHIEFPDYTNTELFKIAQLFLKKQNYSFSAEAQKAFEEYIDRRKRLPFFANARSVRNALDRAKLRQANRLFSRKDLLLSKEELINIESIDIRSSSVFEGKLDRDTCSAID
tara:strand:- start:1973 stop:2875 length:903 start_codon:yes stop_codon:yes gene_type:complete